MTEPSPPQRMIALIDEVHRLRGRLASALSGIRETSGLSQAESLVLSAAVNAVVPPTVPQIGRSLGHSRQVIQRTADALAGRGLLRWTTNPHHKRAQLLVPTDEGRSLHARADHAAQAWAREIARSIDPERLANAVATLHDIRILLQTPPGERDQDRCRDSSVPVRI